MEDKPRYLLGKGERLTKPVFIPRNSGEKSRPYTYSEQQSRLIPKIASTARQIEQLPLLACPDDRAVIAVTLHPSYLAKSYFPGDLLRAARLRPIGSRAKTVRPESGKAGPSSELFLAGKRADIAAFATVVQRLPSDDEDILTIEDVRSVTPAERLRGTDTLADEEVYEVVLHAPADWGSVVLGFDDYLHSFGLGADVGRRRFIRDLSVMPVKARRDQLVEIATFAFIRVARPMPRLREIPSARDDLVHRRPPTYSFPESAAIDRKIRVAIFDGGLDPASPLMAWARAKDVGPIGPPVPEFLAHGHDVTSALLFGSIEQGELPQPFIEVDHYRVLDASSRDSNGEYYDVLDRIHEVLGKKHYDFVNLSLGPQIPIEDDEIHPWTALLDDVLSHGTTLLMSAVGNDGEADRAAGLARIQPPADGVNVVSIGSCVPDNGNWERATYSCVGPGRSPGVTKPDLVAFGGSDQVPFFVVGPNGTAKGTYGTSFASPNALRIGVGVRAYLGDAVEPLGIRALLLHHAQSHQKDPHELGWGVIPSELDDIVRCGPSVVHVLYQGLLEPRQHRRFPIPLPDEELVGMIRIDATLCVASETDPKDPFNYTRAGAMPTFRPHSGRFDEWVDEKSGQLRKSVAPKAQSFFKPEERLTEQMRRDFRMWETVLHASNQFRSSSLKDPMFDIHYNPREGGGDSRAPAAVPYALVVTVAAPKTPDLYDRIATRYRTQLQPLNPVVEIQVRSRDRG